MLMNCVCKAVNTYLHKKGSRQKGDRRLQQSFALAAVNVKLIKLLLLHHIYALNFSALNASLVLIQHKNLGNSKLSLSISKS